MAVRAKFRCHSIKLQQASTPKPGLTYDRRPEHQGKPYVDEEGNRYDTAEAYIRWDQPTVYLVAVVGGSEENSQFFAATPSATCELTISNPDAAEYFELGGEYYVDFEKAK